MTLCKFSHCASLEGHIYNFYIVIKLKLVYIYKGYRRDLRDLHTIIRKVEISMLENEIEKALVNKVKIHGGLCLKFTSPSMTGIPDRIILLPKGKIGFVETKRPGGEPRPIQKKRIRQFKNLGFKVYVLDSKDNIDEIIKKIGGD